jgi:hypothetical protein
MESCRFGPRGPEKENAVDVARAGDQPDALIEKRARGRVEANAAEMAWKASTRRHHEKLRRARRAEWFAPFSCLAASLRASADEFDAQAEALLVERCGGEG